MMRVALSLVSVGIAATAAIAHDTAGHKHSTSRHAGHGPAVHAMPHGASPAVPSKVGVAANTPGFPLLKRGDFSLVDQNGRQRTSRDPDGRYQLVFFGYFNCEAICSEALPRLAAAVDRLAEKGDLVSPVMITVDPERDTVAAIRSQAARIHPRLVGLTGDEAALEVARKAFQVTRSLVFVSPEHGAVYAHGSYLFLLDPSGEFLTLVPPVVGPDEIAAIVTRYIAK